MSKTKSIRTRFSPAPTGFLHIGSARTALFNYLFVQKNKGAFVLRIEDTDKERSKKEFEEDIIEGLDWLGIKWDEGPVINGDEKGMFKPYRQSNRKKIYKKYLEKLLNGKKAYYCFCAKEELEAKKESRLGNGLAPKYDGKCSNLSEKEVFQKLGKGESFVIRIKMPEEIIEIKDLIRGKITFNTGLIGDIVIAKNMETPLYNFTVVVDDFEMKITHVIRGEDLLSNTPKQVIIFRALGLEPPKFGHLPLILGEDRTKLSKRHGAVSVLEYGKQGYLKEAVINFWK